MKIVRTFALVSLLGLGFGVVAPLTARADVYMQSPRGSNNRLNESSGSGSDVIDWLIGLFF